MVCFICVAFTAAGVYLLTQPVRTVTSQQPGPVGSTAQPVDPGQPSLTPNSPDRTVTPEAPKTLPSILEGAERTENTLNTAIVPIADRRDLAERLSGTKNFPETIPAPSSPRQVGDRQSFYVLNTDSNAKTEMPATLQYITPHLYFWVGDSIQFNAAELKNLAETFESRIYPTDREFFGTEWSPGVDNDVHLYILFTRGMGNSVAGFFSSADEYPPQVQDVFKRPRDVFSERRPPAAER